MTTSTLEKAAREVRTAAVTIGEAKVWAFLTCSSYDDYDKLAGDAERAIARAVLRAIREPEGRVLEAMVKLLPGGDDENAQRPAALAVWQAGIDAMMEG